MFEQLYEALLNAITNQQNQFLSGGLVLMLVGAVAAYARRLPGRIYHWTLNRFIITLDITNEDPAFFWMAGWLSTQPYSRRARNLSVTTYKDAYGNLRNKSRESQICGSPGQRFEPQLPEIIFTPAPGNHLFFYKRRPIWLVRNRNKPTQDQTGGYNSFFTQESFQLRMIARSQETARALIEEARQLSFVEREIRTDIYIFGGYDGFRRVDGCDTRPLSSVFLPEGQVEEIVSDVRKFLGNREWYQSRGIPWRRGYLFHGIPGTGKTTLIRGIVGEFKMDLYIVNLASTMDDRGFLHALSNVPPCSAILLEDADATFDQREKNQDVKNSLSFSGVLNALDGAASREGWLVFMTTNHKDRLDEALIRPGRADVHIEFGYATAFQARSMFAAFFPGANGAEVFGQLVERQNMTMAAVQQHLIFHQKSSVEALATLPIVREAKAVGAAT